MSVTIGADSIILIAMYRYRNRRDQSTNTIHVLIAGVGVALVALLVPGAMQQVNTALAVIIGISIVASVGFLWVLRQARKRDREQLRAITVASVDRMTGVEFERYVGALLRHQGFAVQFTRASGDYGIDIVARRGADRYGVQLKRYASAVGRSAISDAVAGKAYYMCNKAMVITNNYFTPAAKELAAMNHCELVDRSRLSEWIREFQMSKAAKS